MKPSQIQSLARSAQKIDAERKYGTTEAFILSWVAWEGFLNRIIYVGLAKHGWRLNESQTQLRTSQLYTRFHYERLFKHTFGSEPAQTRFFGKTWSEAEKFRDYRNRILHGGVSTKPETLSGMTESLTNYVLEPSWTDGIEALVDGVNHRLPPVYSRIHVPKNLLKDGSELASLLRCLKSEKRQEV